ncbi:MAG: carboxypeptidase regulatory-like domain-containing protein [Bacteroidales bacterium]|nr:carboxypeptidase regulatory-like domain-containing protein [Bacteroidales bacterium]
MRHFFLLAIALLALCLQARAQVFIVNDNLTTGRMAEIHASVVDSLTNEPIPFASFYVIPAKDTTISNFTLTDAEGIAKLDDVPYGEYVLHVEMLGYKPFIKSKYFRDRRVDMGTVKLQVDHNYLKAAVVSDVGNPIVVKQDTVEFNASSFQIGTNDMLKDLIKRMPGMEITDDGKVKFNGEEIDKLTVGGRTFFFGDQSTALNNLPASIVDKIRVIDRESESTRSSGLQDGSREKVLDVGLKKEYEQGWFGNAGLKGGATMAGDKDDQLRDDRGLLYSGNSLVSAYSEKDQVTVIANGMNLNESNGVVFVMVSSDGTRATNADQIASAAQFGVNANTSRIKNVETTASANYKYGDSMSGTRSFRTTHQDDGDIMSGSSVSGRSFSNSLTTNLEFQKESGKTRFHFRPTFKFSKEDSRNTTASETSIQGVTANSSESATSDLGFDRLVSGNGNVVFREIGGKKNRTLSLLMSGNLENEDGKRFENSVMGFSDGYESRSLRYSNKSDSRGGSGSVTYGEPLTEKLTLSASATLNLSKSDRISDAFDKDGLNSYYSSESRSRAIRQSYGTTAQYTFKQGSWITLGANFNGTLQETYSKSFNISRTTGEGDWFWFMHPTVRIQHSFGSNRLNLSLSGYSQQASATSMRPTMDITDPSRPTIGNIYLRPYGYTYFNTSLTRSDKKRFSSLTAYLYGNITKNPVTYTRWYDSDGILYSVPVNSRKNSFSGSLSAYYNTPLDESKKFTLSTGVYGSINLSTSYQAKGTLAGVDMDAFDYSTFMDAFWGGADGDVFFSGKSGFSESDTRTFSPGGHLDFRYRSDRLSAKIGASLSTYFARYSLNKSLDMDTFSPTVGMEFSYTTKHEFEFQSDLNYAWYYGYAEGYGDPEWQWNGEISKNIGAFNLSVKVHDILDQTRNLTHTVTANYEEDSYRLVMGRYVLFGIKWNFCKMNASHNQKAQNAAWNMVW